jgi:hypothetical protein
MHASGICVLARRMREFYTFIMSSALRHSPATRCYSTANYMRGFLPIFSKNIVTFEYAFRRLNICFSLMF